MTAEKPLIKYRTILDTGSYYEFCYSCVDREFLEQSMRELKSKIDPYRSPRLGTPYYKLGEWHQHITYYGLD